MRVVLKKSSLHLGSLQAQNCTLMDFISAWAERNFSSRPTSCSGELLTTPGVLFDTCVGFNCNPTCPDKFLNGDLGKLWSANAETFTTVLAVFVTALCIVCKVCVRVDHSLSISLFLSLSLFLSFYVSPSLSLPLSLSFFYIFSLSFLSLYLSLLPRFVPPPLPSCLHLSVSSYSESLSTSCF